MLNIIAEEKISHTYGATEIEVLPKGFRFRFVDQQSGEAYAPFHDKAGLLIDGASVSLVESTDSENELRVKTVSGDTAKVTLALSEGVVAVTITPEAQKVHTVELRFGFMPVAHGLGDSGGFNESFNLVGDETKRFAVINNGGAKRWASSFVIFPGNNMAGVYLGNDKQSVGLGPDGYSMQATKQGKFTFHYFLGDIQSIYRNYLKLRTTSGYPNIKPKFRLFELGWESWASLGWSANSKTVKQEIQWLLDEGLPVRWAVTGSGFWKEGRTTTDFGDFGAKFPDAAEFRTWCHERNVKWMIGLRTNFVPSGGPFVPKSQKRDRNLKTDRYFGNPVSDELLSKGYFWTENGTPEKVTSRWFPQVPCYILDGRNPEAAIWYAQQYKLWGVDGIKEDTMMEANIGIFNGPVSKISEDGGLVMARCGSFSSPGTLLRINDTAGARDMARRLPINYLQNAACGAPNAYSDTIGYKDNPENEENLRHGWMMACTAGLAVGPFNWKDPKMRKAFKRMIQFHYEIAPTMYDAAMKSYQTGYPYTMTPLDIAFPDDSETSRTPTFQWMIGESLMAAPLVKNITTGKQDIYLPKGVWYDYDTGKKYEGPQMLRDYSVPIDKTPCFVGGKGVIVTRTSDDEPLTATVFPMPSKREPYIFTHPDGMAQSKITFAKQGKAQEVTDLTTGKKVPSNSHQESGALSFILLSGHEYSVE